MILAIDFGASSTSAVLLDDRRIVLKAAAPKQLCSKKEIIAFLKRNGFNSFKIRSLALTGGRSAFFKGKILGLKPLHVNELDAIGLGAAYLSDSKRCLAVSMGTGTCIVLFEKGRSRHVIGTGIGGGTILGLSKILLWETGIVGLARLAKSGDFRKADLSVKEVVGKGIGLVGGEATASNLAKARGSRADVAAAIQNMVAESVAVLSVMASRAEKCKKIVFLGKTPQFPLVRERLLETAKCFKTSFTFPENHSFGTAFGAALLLERRAGPKR